MKNTVKTILLIILCLGIGYYFAQNNSGGPLRSEKLANISGRERDQATLNSPVSTIDEEYKDGDKGVVGVSNGKTTPTQMTTLQTTVAALVSDVDKTVENIENNARALDGIVVNTKININSQNNTTATIELRLPRETANSFLDDIEKAFVKTQYKNVVGVDITDSYTDIEARLTRLRETQKRFEEIMQQTNDIQQILNIQKQIFSLQDQIDSYVGKEKYLESASKTTFIRINLATDAAALPYEPTQGWGPKATFTRAVRSLVTLLTGLMNIMIWAIVYLPVILAVWYGVKFVKKKFIK